MKHLERKRLWQLYSSFSQMWRIQRCRLVWKTKCPFSKNLNEMCQNLM